VTDGSLIKKLKLRQIFNFFGGVVLSFNFIRDSIRNVAYRINK